MRITNILIENFRSIKHLEFSPNLELNAIIGGNSTGKSNIFDAINWVLGAIYPSFNSVKKEDYFKGDNTQKIKIKITFEDSHYLELAEEWTDYRGNVKTGLNYDRNYCNDETRRKYCSAYIGVERQITDYLPSNKWSLLGRILQEINNKFIEERLENGVLKSEKLKQELDKIRDELLFSVKDENDTNIMDEFLKILKEESAKQLNCADCDFNINLNLYDPWNFYKTLQLIVKEREMGVEFQASQLGMGFQASVTIAILKAYAHLKLRNQPPILIDEPELFLHPHAQKNFYQVLKDLTDNDTQIFYITHSPNFLSLGDFEQIYVTRKGPEGTFLRFAELDRFIVDLMERARVTATGESIKLHYKNAYENTGDSRAATEAFFAKKILLVEGSSETLLLSYLFTKLGFDYVKEGISIVACGSKGELDRFLRLYSEFGIHCYMIFDGDKHLAGTSEERANIEANKELFSFLDSGYMEDYPDNRVKPNYLGFEDELEKNLNFETNKKGLRLFIESKKKFDDENITIPQWIAQVIEKIKAMPAEAESILKQGEVAQDDADPF